MSDRELKLTAKVEVENGKDIQRATTWVEALIQASEMLEKRQGELSQSSKELKVALEQGHEAANAYALEQKELREDAERLGITIEELVENYHIYNRELARLDMEIAQAATSTKEFELAQANVAEEIEQNTRLTWEERKALIELEKRFSSMIGEIDEYETATKKASQATKEQEDATKKSKLGYLEYLETINSVIRPVNSFRFHSTQLATALGLGGAAAYSSSQGNKELRETVNALDRTIDTLNSSIKNLTENLEKQHKRTNAVEQATDALGTEIQDAGERAYYLNEALFESTTQLTIWENKAKAAELEAQTLALQMNNVGEEAEEADHGIKEMATAVDKLGDELRETNRHLKDTDDQLEKTTFKSEALAQTVGGVMEEVFEEAAQAAVEFAKESVEAFFEFDRKSREVFTLIPQASGQMREKLKKDVLLLGTELGRLPEEILPAVYNGLSAGIPEENILSDVEIASDAARAGVADLNETMKLGVAVLNAQVPGVESLTDVYDQLFFLVRKGVTTFPELTGEMSKVTSVAGEAGVSMQDIVSAMIVMTRQGDSTAEATELLSIMLTQLATSGSHLSQVFEEASGRSFRQFIDEGGNLAGAMQLLQQHANNSGKALGDMLGGDSPFFRDTQAARGVLELTGKHLESLVQFANEAESATGAMGQAAAEMGESAELGTLRYTAALEELKIAQGELLANQLTPLAENATQVLRVWSGNQQNSAHNAVQQLIEDHNGLEVASSKLLKLYNELDNPLGRVTGGFKTIREEIKLVAAQAIDYNSSNDEIRDRLQGLFGDQADVIGQYVYLNNELIGSVDAMRELAFEYDQQQALVAGASDDIAIYDQKLMHMNSTLDEGTELIEEQTIATSDLITVFDGLSTAETRLAFAAGMAKDTHQEASLEYEVTQEELNRVRDAHAEAEAATLRHNEAYGNYVVQARNATGETVNWKDQLFQSAAQMGVNQDVLIALMDTSGAYTEDQKRAILTEAAMRTAVEELSVALANKEITVGDAIAALDELETQLQEDYTAQFDYTEVTNAKVEAMNLEGALTAASGDYGASFVTSYHTVGTPPSVPTGQDDRQDLPNEPVRALHSGGHAHAGETVLVGDGPGGQVLPTSELVTFGQDATVFPGDITNALLSNNGGDTYIEIHTHVEGGANQQETADAYVDSTIDALRQIGAEV